MRKISKVRTANPSMVIIRSGREEREIDGKLSRGKRKGGALEDVKLDQTPIPTTTASITTIAHTHTP
jgi:hypothetical protein